MLKQKEQKRFKEILAPLTRESSNKSQKIDPKNCIM